MSRFSLSLRTMCRRGANVNSRPLGGKRLRACDRLVLTAIVYRNHSLRFECLFRDRGKGPNDVALLVRCRNHNINCRLSPVLGRCWNGLVRPLEQPDQTQDRAGTQDEIRNRGHGGTIVLTDYPSRALTRALGGDLPGVKLFEELNLTGVIEIVRCDSADERDLRGPTADGGSTQFVWRQVGHDATKRVVLVTK